MGILCLGEVLTLPTAFGTIVIVLAVMILAKKDDRITTNWPIWALALPIGAAAIRAFAHVLTKIGMEEVPDAYLAGLVGFVVSALITLCINMLRRGSPSSCNFFSVKLALYYLTCPVAAGKSCRRRFFSVKMAIQDLTSLISR